MPAATGQGEAGGEEREENEASARVGSQGSS